MFALIHPFRNVSSNRRGIRQRAMASFLDKKEFRPGLEPFNRAGE